MAKRIYFAAPLFTFAEQMANVAVADAIRLQSSARYECVLPQAIPWPEPDPKMIREINLGAISSADAGIFNLDGPEADSGTVVEYMWAVSKCKPCVLWRTDLRANGDLDGMPFNLMLSGWPLTRVVLANTFVDFRSRTVDGAQHHHDASCSLQGAIRELTSAVAQKIIAALDDLMPG